MEAAWLIASGAGLLGLVVGSFINVVIHRLPIMLERDWKHRCRETLGQVDSGESTERFDLVAPRSRCPQCGHMITALENIPLISFLAQKGKCRHCGSAISVQYPLVEALTALVSAIVVLQFGWTPQAAAALVLTWGLVALAGIDFRTQLLPDIITIPGLWLGLGLALVPVFASLESSVIGAMAGYLSLWTVYQLFRLLTGKEGMGFGDFKLLALLGAWLGWQYLPTIVILSSMVGAVCGIAMIVFRGRDRSVPMPFGPFLAAAGWFALIWGEQINAGYLRFAGIS